MKSDFLTETEASSLFRTGSNMIMPSDSVPLLSFNGQTVEPSSPPPGDLSFLRQRTTQITIVAGLLLVSSLTNLPLVIQLLLAVTLGLVIYGMIVASFRQIRLWLLLGLLALTSFNLLHGLSAADVAGLGLDSLALDRSGPAIASTQSAAEDFQASFSHPEQYPVLVDELFVSQACWNKHARQFKRLKRE